MKMSWMEYFDEYDMGDTHRDYYSIGLKIWMVFYPKALELAKYGVPFPEQYVIQTRENG